MRACELTPALRQRLDEIGAQISQGVGKGLDEAMGRQAASRFVAWMTDTWTRTMSRDEHGVFVVTGDIPAMWLRDSSAQLWPFLIMCDLPEVTRQIGDVIARQWHCIDVDPYANAFNSGPTGAHFDADDLDVADELWERKYEVDSLAFPVDLAWRYWQATGSPEHLNGAVHQGCIRIIDVWSLEQDHARSTYRHVRPAEPSDTLGRDGSGTPVGHTGMTWSGFRPSDDACRYGYNIPAQFMAMRALRQIREFCRVWDDEDLVERATKLADEIDAGVRQFGIVEDHLAYEVDGLGSVLEMDDANMPSLLSLPLTSDLGRDVRSTRAPAAGCSARLTRTCSVARQPGELVARTVQRAISGTLVWRCRDSLGTMRRPATAWRRSSPPMVVLAGPTRASIQPTLLGSPEGGSVGRTRWPACS